MAGILEMIADDLVNEFLKLCIDLFSGNPTVQERTNRLKNTVKRIIGKYMRCPGGEGRLMISAQDSYLCVRRHPTIWHPLDFSATTTFRTNPSPNCLIWEAACATLAMPELFEPIYIGSDILREPVVGGEIRWANPTRYLADEAATVFSGCHIACIVSIGSGHPEVLSVSTELAKTFKNISTDSQLQADEMAARFMGVSELYWRLEVEQGLQEMRQIEDVASLGRILSSTASHLQKCVTSERIDALLRVIRDRPERVPASAVTGKVSGAAQTIRLKQCPAPTMYFIGKDASLKDMDEYFTSDREGCRVGVLYGVGGSGKSQLGLKFIQRSRKNQQFTEVFFMDASDANTLHGDFETLARATSSGSTVEDALHYLSSNQGNWLLFLDNADDIQLDLRPFVSWLHGNVLITTRNQALRIYAPDCHIHVKPLTMDESVALLMHGLAQKLDETTKPTAEEIVKELGCLPLAVSHARAYLARGSCDLNDYLRLYRSDHTLLHENPVPFTDNYEYSVYATWMLSFKQLSELAVVFLQLLCFLHHERIPSQIVEMAFTKYGEGRDYYADRIPQALCAFLTQFESQTNSWSPSRFHSLLNDILSLSLIQSDVVNHTLEFHLLVQKLLRSLFETQSEMISASQSLLSLAIPTGIDSGDYAFRRTFIPHIRSSEKYGTNVHHDLLFSFGQSYYDDGKYDDGCRIWKKEFELKEQILGPEHPDTLKSMNNLAISYRDLGRAAEALPLDKQVLEARKRALGLEHLDTLKSMNNLAITYRDLGRAAEALPLDEQVLEARTRVLGPDHPDTLTSMNNLAISYINLGRAVEALPLHKQVLEARKRVLGHEHPHTLRSMNNLAISHRNLGHAVEALPLYEQVLEARKRVLGAEHPHTLKSMNNLAISYKFLGRAVEALPLDEEVLEARKRVLGPEHPDTLGSMSSLAVLYKNLGRLAEALPLYEQILEVRKKILGSEHSHTLKSMSSLATLYRNLGRAAEALLLDEQVLELRKRVHGFEHPDTLGSMSSLATVYRDLGRSVEALPLLEQVLAARKRVLGTGHPHTLVSMSGLAILYRDLGRPAEALPLYEQVLEICSYVP
ncbi:hypothetical protein DL96DRAFT_1679305 [Flagelloscypha sp. PMI_526]|nr:hypothetical protein DL96DRAFT_1679305 [Flagelloscypha sp. PMI_526]